MIRKFLVCGKTTVHLQSKHSEGYRHVGTVHELLLPVRTLWDIEDLIGKIRGEMAAGASSLEVDHYMKNIYKISARFALYEVSRIWLYRKGNGKPT